MTHRRSHLARRVHWPRRGYARRRLRTALVLAVLLALAIASSAILLTRSLTSSANDSSELPAAVAARCGDLVIRDWFDNGRFDNPYRPGCYNRALDSLPEGAEDISGVKDLKEAIRVARARSG